jgi:hypothetical protein
VFALLALLGEVRIAAQVDKYAVHTRHPESSSIAADGACSKGMSDAVGHG